MGDYMGDDSAAAIRTYVRGLVNSAKASCEAYADSVAAIKEEGHCLTLETWYYVDRTNGNDANDGRSSSSAFKTLDKLFSLYNEGLGDIRANIISAGTYDVSFHSLNGVVLHLKTTVAGVTIRFTSTVNDITWYNSHIRFIGQSGKRLTLLIPEDSTQRTLYSENCATRFEFCDIKAPYFTFGGYLNASDTDFYGQQLGNVVQTSGSNWCCVMNGSQGIFTNCGFMGMTANRGGALIRRGSCYEINGTLKIGGTADGTDSAMIRIQSATVTVDVSSIVASGHKPYYGLESADGGVYFVNGSELLANLAAASAHGTNHFTEACLTVLKATTLS